uniref:Uncharacterized protein n=1 Tax=Cacopsylla melanoneura TaxID=428564 RepID=A0A8D8TPS1_9HEMI
MSSDIMRLVGISNRNIIMEVCTLGIPEAQLGWEMFLKYDKTCLHIHIVAHFYCSFGTFNTNQGAVFSNSAVSSKSILRSFILRVVEPFQDFIVPTCTFK